MTETTNESNEANFAELFGAVTTQYKEGEVVRGTVLSIDEDHVHAVELAHEHRLTSALLKFAQMASGHPRHLEIVAVTGGHLQEPGAQHIARGLGLLPQHLGLFQGEHDARGGALSQAKPSGDLAHADAVA